MMAPTDVPKIAADLVWRLLDDNAIVVSPKVGEVRVLNRMGTIIWQHLIEGESLKDIEDYLVTNFRVSHQDARSDLKVFFNDLAERGVITWETSETPQASVKLSLPE
jgi:hypothetical protein